MVLARPDEREIYPYHFSLRLFTMVRRYPCGPITVQNKNSHPPPPSIAGADPNTSIRGNERPIQHAAREGYSEIIEYLLEKGAKIDAKDEGGDTALLYAARYGHARCLQVLLANGANHTVKNHIGDDLMSLAVESDNDQILKVLENDEK